MEPSVSGNQTQDLHVATIHTHSMCAEELGNVLNDIEAGEARVEKIVTMTLGEAQLGIDSEPTPTVLPRLKGRDCGEKDRAEKE